MGFNIRSIVRSFGILNNKGIVNVCKETGEKLIQTAQKQGGGITITNVEKSLKQTFPAAKNIIISESYDTYHCFMKNLGNYDDEIISRFYNNSLSFVIANAKTQKTLLSLRLKGMEPAVAINTAVHELEHALLRTNSTSSLLSKFKRVVLPEKILDSMRQKGPLVNSKIQEFQLSLLRYSKIGNNAVEGSLPSKKGTVEGLKEFLNVSNEKRVHASIRNIIRQKVILPENHKDNLILLRCLKAAIKDEQRAYKVGGEVMKKHLKQEKGCTKSEMYAVLYGEAIKVIAQEIKLQRINKIKNFFHLKIRDYSRT